MIRTFQTRAVEALWTDGKTGKIDARLRGQIIRRLDLLQQALLPEDMNVPGLDFHRLRGVPVRYTVHVNGPWCITFG